ncbi:MAG: hypothetical protein P4L71_22125, partial [Acetobacteraceae bacterium]|nr:hypothetical protein [Acetobacteraceae bacterium]
MSASPALPVPLQAAPIAAAAGTSPVAPAAVSPGQTFAGRLAVVWNAARDGDVPGPAPVPAAPGSVAPDATEAPGTPPPPAAVLVPPAAVALPARA